MFTDQVKIRCKGGKGGDGITSWRREKYIAKGGPYGGNGGDGGAVIIKSDARTFSLDALNNRRHVWAENGQDGRTRNQHGRRGGDLLLKVPCGTLARDGFGGKLLCDLVHPGEEFLLCKGGKGGKGNAHYKTSVDRAPVRSTLGKLGEVNEVELELKLIADVALLGLPNAGKSTLFSKLAAVSVKIDAYPFTTLKPNLSYVEFDDFSRIYLADIPGIISGACRNKGLGLSFLRHSERASILAYVIDLSGEEGRDPFEDFLTLRNEVKHYSLMALKKPFFVVLNKVDKGERHLATFKRRYQFSQETLFVASALQGRGLFSLVQSLKDFNMGGICSTKKIGK